MTNARSEPGVLQATVGRVRGPAYEATTDFLSVEEPLEVRLDGEVGGRRTRAPVAVTMRSPGNDPELAVGFLFTEGVVAAPDDVTEVEVEGPLLAVTNGNGTSNVVIVWDHGRTLGCANSSRAAPRGPWQQNGDGTGGYVKDADTTHYPVRRHEGVFHVLYCDGHTAGTRQTDLLDALFYAQGPDGETNR